MRFEIESSGSNDYGDYATVRIHFDAESWIEIDAADAHDLNKPYGTSRYSQGAKITIHNADGFEEVVWDGFVMPKWFAEDKQRND